MTATYHLASARHASGHATQNPLSSAAYQRYYEPAAPLASSLPPPSFGSMNSRRSSSATQLHQRQYESAQPARVLGGGYAADEGEYMVEGLESSPYSSELSEFEADETMDDEDFYESEESFDGPLKEEYRGRSWSASAGQDNAAAAAAAVWHQQQQQPAQRSTVGQEAAAAATRVYDQQQHIDRLFHGLGQQQQRVSAYVSPVTKEVARSPAPAPAPAHTAAQSPVALAEFLADGVWSLLLTPYAPASKDVAVTRYEGARSAKVGAYEEDCWSSDPYRYQSSPHHTPPQLTLDDFSQPFQAAQPIRRQHNPYYLASQAPRSFAKFAQQTLAQTLISPTGIVLALWYIARAPIHEGGGEEGRQFREGLRAFGTRDGVMEDVPRMVLTLGLAWANKWLDDNTFTNRSWSDVTHLPLVTLNRLELLSLSTHGFVLSISNTEWAAWLQTVHSSTPDVRIRAHLEDMADALFDADQRRELALAERVQDWEPVDRRASVASSRSSSRRSSAGSYIASAPVVVASASVPTLVPTSAPQQANATKTASATKHDAWASASAAPASYVPSAYRNTALTSCAQALVGAGSYAGAFYPQQQQQQQQQQQLQQPPFYQQQQLQHHQELYGGYPGAPQQYMMPQHGLAMGLPQACCW